MAEISEQRLGYGFGLLGGALVALGGIVGLVVGAADLIAGRTFGAMNATSEAIVLFVLGGLSVFFAWLGHRAGSFRPLASGVLLVVMAVVGWVVAGMGPVGLGAYLLALVGSLFVLVAGILYLLEPATKAVKAVATA